jgi:hypothetical protein
MQDVLSIVVGKRPLGIAIKMHLKENGYQDADWIYLAEGKLKRWVLVKSVMNLQIQ